MKGNKIFSVFDGKLVLISLLPINGYFEKQCSCKMWHFFRVCTV